MKICYLSNQYPKVSHTFIRREIQALEQLGCSILRVCARQNVGELVDPSDIRELEKVHSIAQGKILAVLFAGLIGAVTSPVKFLKAASMSFSLGCRDGGKIHKYLIYLAEACYLKKLCREHKVDHIHAHFATNPAAVALLCKIMGGPGYSFTVHGPEEFDRPLSLSLGRKIHGATFVVAISYFCRSQLYRWCLSYQEWPKIHIVRCALDRESFAKPSPIITANKKQLIAVGRLCEQKGFPLLLEAILLLKQQGVVGFHFNIVGDGPMRRQMELFIRDNELSELVTIVGYKSSAEVNSLLDQSCCLVVPSFAEGLPVVIMEAFARGRPVLVTQIAAMSELVEHGISGWIVPAGDVGSLVDGISRAVAADGDLLNTMGGKGREKVAEQHDSLVEAKKLQELFSDSLNLNSKAEVSDV